MADKTFKVTLFKSVSGTRVGHRACVRGLGLKKIGSSRVLLDTPANRGMAIKVQYMVKSEG
jgi:large subunit ribosomal protein L30